MTPQRTDIDYAEFRKLLLAERARHAQSIVQEREEISEEQGDFNDNELSTLDINEPADTAVQTYDRSRFEALDENTREIVERIDEALERLKEGTYGICVVTGKPIPIARLRAMPWASMTVEAAERTDR